MKSTPPPYLQKGDTVAIIATARKITIEELQPAFELLNKWELKTAIGTSIGLTHHQFAGTDEERANDFQEALDNPNIKAIWCARGGYGTVRIIDKLDFSNFIQHPKWIIGFSDPTVLHAHVHNLGIQTIHSFMPITTDVTTDTAKNSLHNSLFGKSNEYVIPSHPLNRKGVATGELIGGNLSVLYSLLGSKSSVCTKNKILFIEDLDEYLYHIDRMLLNLKRNGYLNNLAGLVVGGMTAMHDNAIPFGKSAKEIIIDAVAEYKYPICFDFPAGHIDNNNTLVMGQEMQLTVDDNVKLESL